MRRCHRTLNTLFFTQIMALTGFSCVFLFFPLYIQTLGPSGAAVLLWVGGTSFVGSATLAVASPIWGAALVTVLLIGAPISRVVLLLIYCQGGRTGTVIPVRLCADRCRPPIAVRYTERGYMLSHRQVRKAAVRGWERTIVRASV